MTEVKDIVFEDYWYNEFCDETEIYFEAPKSYLNGKYPEADYGWHYYPCVPEFKQALYDIFGNRGKENS